MSTDDGADWVPGDPLHRAPGHHYGGYLFNFRDSVETDVCKCVDAASWPTPDHGDELDPPWMDLTTERARSDVAALR